MAAQAATGPESFAPKGGFRGTDLHKIYEMGETQVHALRGAASASP